MAWTHDKEQSVATIKLPNISEQQVHVHDCNGSTFVTQDAKQVRLKNAEIGYTLSTAFLKKLNVQSLRLYVNSNNLFTLCGLYPGDDPEQFSAGGDWGPYPNTRTVNFGFNIKF